MSLRFLRALAAGLALAVSLPACEVEDSADEQNATAATGRFETFVGDDGQTYFQLLAKNGERILRSEGYTSLSGAKKGITSVKKNGTSEARFKVLQADSGEFYFNLVATNGQVIGTSEMYASQANAEGGVDAVMSALANPTSAAAETGGPRFETFKGSDNKTYFRLRAGNGQIVLQSQGYASKSGANGGIESVKKNGVDASHFDVFAGADGQHGFRLKAGNGQVIGRGEMYVSKSNALRGADRVRDILREMTGSSEASDAEIQAEIESAADGLLFMSESDYPFTFVSAAAPGADVTEALVREKMASIVDNDDDADKPMADLVSMSSTWDEWKAEGHMCWDPSDPDLMVLCNKMRNVEQVLEANLDNIQVYYFGRDGEPGNVEGVGVSLFIVGRSPSGNLVGVRTLLIWT
ncbi:MAG: DUF1508 domain-containing protein [Polyangiaceae bacterium]|nr:DUF1508 domain-containing protein [Polyangiaceae bacterium]